MNNNQFFRPNSHSSGGQTNGHPTLPPQLPTAPTSPTIFVGHFGVTQSTDHNACFAGRELTLHQPARLEGIHVVPFGISPPGLSIEGKTLPSMMTRPFHLHMFARNTADKQITSVFLLTIHGGVQWMPIPPPFNDLIVDFVAFEGDFEALSIIINGFPVNGTTPVNAATLSSVTPVVVELDSDDEEGKMEDCGEKIDKTDNPVYVVQLSAQSAGSTSLAKLNSKLRKTMLKTDGRAELASRIEYRLHSTWLSNSLVSIKSVAVLVGEIFSFAESYSTSEGENKTSSSDAEEIRSKIRLLNRLTTYMTDCWTNGNETLIKPEEDSPVDVSTASTDTSRDLVGSVIGPEAANLLCTIVVHGFDLLNFESFLVGSIVVVKKEDQQVNEKENGDGAMDVTSDARPLTDDERRALFDQYTEALLRGCSAILANNFTATEFLDCGGVAVLSGLLQQQSHISSPLFLLLLTVVSDAVRHHSIALKFNEPLDQQQLHSVDELGLLSAQDKSPYQSLLYVAAGLKAETEETVHCGKALRWCALVECLHQLSLLSYSVFTEVSTAADALAARHASVNNNTMGDTTAEDHEDGPAHVDIRSVLHASCGVVTTLFSAVSMTVETLLTAIIAVHNDLVHNDIRDMYVPLLHTLSKGKIMVSLLALASLTQIARDLSTSVDWTAPHASGLIDNTRALQTLFLTLLKELLKLPHIETLLVIHSEEVQLLFNFLCPPGTSMLTCRSLDELRETDDIHIDCGDLTHNLQSYGWALWLTAHVFTVSSAELHPLRACLQDDDQTDLTGPQLTSIHSWSSSMSELTACHVSRCVMCRVIAQFYLRDIGLLINKVSMQYSASSSDVGKQTLRSLLTVVEMCCHSTNILVVTSVASHSAMLVANLTVAKENLVFSNIDSDDEDEEDDEKVSKKPDTVSQLIDKLLIKLQPTVNTVDKTKYSRSSIFRKLLKSFSVSTVTNEEDSLKFVRSVREQLDDCKTSSSAISQATAGSAVDILSKCVHHFNSLQTHLATIVRGEGDNDSDGEAETSNAMSGENKPVTTENILSSRPGVKDSLRYYTTLADILRAVLCVVHYAVLTTPDEVSTNLKIAAADIVHADRLVTTTVDVYCTVSSLMNAASCSPTAEASRAVLFLSVEILRLFCPPHAARAETCSLIAYLTKKAFRMRLKHFEDVCALLDDLLPNRFVANVEGETVESRLSAFESQHLSEGEKDFAVTSQNRLVNEDAQLVQWVAFMRRELVVSRNAQGEAIYHAISRTPVVLTSSASSGALNEAVPGKAKKRRFSDVASRPVDTLARSLSERRYSLEAVILGGVMSSSKSTQRHAASLTHKYIAISKDLASILSTSLMSTLSFAVDNHLTPTIDDAVELVSQQAALVRFLAFIDAVCHEDLTCFTLIQRGLLKPLFSVLQSTDAGVALLGLQALTALYRTLSRMASRNQTERDATLPAVDDLDSFLNGSIPERDSLSFSALLIIESLGALLAEQLPKTVLKFQENLLILQQCPITLQLLSVAHNKQFLHHLSQIGSGVTLEFLAVKLWIAFEESFKLLSDSSVDPRRQRQLSKEEAVAAAFEQEKINCEGHVQFERASWALQAIVDCIFLAYTQGWVQLSTVARAMRTSQTDPKKVTRRIQRAYTMWAIGLATATGDEGGYHRNIQTVVKSFTLLHSLSENETFDSRHALVCFALKSLVDNMNVLSVYLVNKEKTFGGASDSGVVCFGSATGQISEAHQKEITGLDLQTPFSVVSAVYPHVEKSLLDEWFVRYRYSERLGARGDIASLSTIDGDFHKEVVTLSEVDRRECFPVRFEVPPSNDFGEVRKRMTYVRDEEKKKKTRLAETAAAATTTALTTTPIVSAVMPMQMAPQLTGAFNPPQFAAPPGGAFGSYASFGAGGPRPSGLAQGLPPFNPAHAAGPPPFAPHNAPPRAFLPPGIPAPAAMLGGAHPQHLPSQHQFQQHQLQFHKAPQQQSQFQHASFPPDQMPSRPNMFHSGGPPNAPPTAQFPGPPHNFLPPPGPPGRGLPPPSFQQQQQQQQQQGRGPYNEYGRYN